MIHGRQSSGTVYRLPAELRHELGLELHTTGVRRVRQSYVMSRETGKPRFYGERW